MDASPEHNWSRVRAPVSIFGGQAQHPPRRRRHSAAATAPPPQRRRHAAARPCALRPAPSPRMVDAQTSSRCVPLQEPNPDDPLNKGEPPRSSSVLSCVGCQPPELLFCRAACNDHKLRSRSCCGFDEVE